MTDRLPFPECVRRRPGMYIGDTESAAGVQHFAFELIGNAIDEHLRGFADCIDVVVDEDHVEVSDNGRGLDVMVGGSDVFTSLHDAPTRDGHFPHVHISRGTGRGVGLAVVSALADLIVADIARGGRLRRHAYARGVPLAPPEDRGPTGARGTRVSAAPDTSVFSTRLSAASIEERLRELAYLTPGANFSLNGRHLPGGPLDQYCIDLARSDAFIAAPLHVRRTIGDVEVDVACAWRAPDHDPLVLSFASTQRTQSESMHVAGFFDGLKAGLGELASGVRAASFRRAISGGLVAVVHVGLYAPRFGDPARARLDNPEARRAVRIALSEALPVYVTKNARLRRSLAERVANRPRRCRA